MKKAVRIEIEKISNGYLFSDFTENIPGEKRFEPEKTNLFKILKNNEAIGGLIENDDQTIILEVIRHDVPTAPVEPEIGDLKDSVVEKTKFNPFPNKPLDENELRLSVNINNAYSAERLRKIDWLDLQAKLPMKLKRIAEICGKSYPTLFNTYSKIKKGNPTFHHKEQRIYMTVLAKYYESVLGVQSSKKDEIDKIKSEVMEQIESLTEIFNKRSHINSITLEPIIKSLKKSIGINE